MDRRPVESGSTAAASAPRRPPAVVEIVGPAGAGKTTLLRSLASRSDRITCGVKGSRAIYLLYRMGQLVRFGPTFLASGAGTRWFTRAESRAIVYLGAWYRTLRRARAGTVTVFDHGPIFRLATLREFGPALTNGPGFTRWWERAMQRWSESLDMIVWLDAADDRLLERIRGRPQGHVIKDESEPEARAFLRRYRSAYDSIVDKMTDGRGIEVLRFDTGRDPLDGIVRTLLEALGVE
jgi:hypothetical protein